MTKVITEQVVLYLLSVLFDIVCTSQGLCIVHLLAEVCND